MEVGGQEFYLDLLFYHLKLRCYVVIELKAFDFEPGFISQLNMYQNIVNDIMCHSDDKPTNGLLFVKGKNKTVVEYSLLVIRTRLVLQIGRISSHSLCQRSSRAVCLLLKK